MTLELMLIKGDSDYFLSIHYTALCALNMIYLMFITTPGNRMVIPYLQKKKPSWTEVAKITQVHG